jgi:CheY-like chemotaxis protein
MSAIISKKVLLIDDDPLILRMYQNKLAGDGYIVVMAFNGKDGFLQAKNEKPNLILLDLMMPQMNGVETLKLLKGDPETKDIPTIILTSLEAKEEDLAKARELGAHEYLVKSQIDLKDLSEKVASILGAAK